LFLNYLRTGWLPLQGQEKEHIHADEYELAQDRNRPTVSKFEKLVSRALRKFCFLSVAFYPVNKTPPTFFLRFPFAVCLVLCAAEVTSSADPAGTSSFRAASLLTCLRALLQFSATWVSRKSARSAPATNLVFIETKSTSLLTVFGENTSRKLRPPSLYHVRRVLAELLMLHL